MFEELSGVDMFITATVALFDAKYDRLVLANAGHCEVLVADKSGAIQAISPEGMPLGILPAVTFERHVVSLENFRCALFYTDGLIECRNAHGEFFGEERLRDWFKRSASPPRPAAQVSEQFLAHINSFQGATPASDDQTFLFLSDESPLATQQPEISPIQIPLGNSAVVKY
jgi:serine phosphatase RsbU (regulator of sigma subunit)